MIKTRFKVASAFVLLSVLSGTISTALCAEPAVTPFVGTNALGFKHNSASAGWEFTLDRPVIVNSLGLFDAGLDGLSESHRIGIWTTSGSLLVESTVTAGTNAFLRGQFRYVNVPATLLNPGTYVIGAYYEHAGPDAIPENSESIAAYPGINYVQPRYGIGSGLPFPSFGQGVGNGFNHFGPNFLLTPVSPVEQLCPCIGPITGGAWKNHGQYVSCVAKAAEALLVEGIITEDEKDSIVEQAARSDCGKK